MGAKHSSSSASDVNSSPTDFSSSDYQCNGHTTSMKFKSVKNHNSFTTSNSSTPSLRDKIDHLKTGASFDQYDSSDMPDADELERKFLKGFFFSLLI